MGSHGSEGGTPGAWRLEPFEAEDGSVPYERFVGKLSDFQFAALDAAMGRVLAVRGLDLVRTEWLRALGEGLHEFRVRHDAEEIGQMFGGEVSSGAGAPEAVLLRVFVRCSLSSRRDSGGGGPGRGGAGVDLVCGIPHTRSER
jgi:hypothetical protein